MANVKILTETQSDAKYAPIAKGVTNGDSHDHAGGDGAQIDHGGLAGLADDDHTQYLKEKASGGLALEIPNHDHTSFEAGQIDHGAANTAASLSDDDHPQYHLRTELLSAKFRADSSSGGLVVWDTTQFNNAGSDITNSAGSNTRITVGSAKVYRVSFQILLTLTASQYAAVTITRYNSSDVSQETLSTGIVNGDTASRNLSKGHSELFSCAAGDYFTVAFSAGTLFAGDAYNQLSVERVN